MSIIAWLRQHGVVLYSNPASVRAGWFSVLACLEVVMAVTAYWWIAIHFDTQRHLWISVCVGPLLLLRSKKSVAAGVQKFVHYTEDYDPYARGRPRSQWDNWLLFGLSVVISATFSFWLARHWLADFDGWSLIWRGAILGWTISNIGLAVAAAKGAGGLAQTAPIRMHFLRTVRIVHNVIYPIIETIAPVLGAIIAGIIATAAGALHAFGVGAASFGAFAPLLFFFLRARLGDGTFDFRKRAQLATLVIGVILIFGVAVGYLLRALLIRFSVTLYYWKDGLIALPINWLRTLFSTDLATPPELIPGYIGSSHFNFRYTYESLRSTKNLERTRHFQFRLRILLFSPCLFLSSNNKVNVLALPASCLRCNWINRGKYAPGRVNRQIVGHSAGLVFGSFGGNYSSNLRS